MKDQERNTYIWTRQRKLILRQYGFLERGIERTFRYIEMVGVTALLLVAVGDRNAFLSAAIGIGGSMMAGSYAALPLIRAFLSVAPRLPGFRQPKSGIPFSGVAAGTMITITFIVASELAELIEAALRT